MAIVIRILSKELVDDIALSPPPPHRHPFQEVVLLTAGGGTHQIDGDRVTVAAPVAVLIAKGKQHVFMPLPDARGWIINFDEDRLPPYGNWIFSQFFSTVHVSLGSAGKCSAVLKMATLMHEVQSAAPACMEPVLTHLLLAMLALLQAEMRSLVLAETSAGQTDFDAFVEFLTVLDRQFRVEKGVEFYARHLRTTPRRLGALSRTFLGKATAHLIEDRTMSEARRELAFSNTPINQIATDLGYVDHSYFTKVFRRATGESPSQFRQNRLNPSI